MKIKMLKQHNKPDFFIEEDVYLKIQEIVNQSKEEVGWVGFVEREENIFTLTDVVILEQEVHSATTEISPSALEEIATELIETTGDVEKVNKLRYWGHSHVNMSPTPSKQDEDMLLEIGKDSNDYFIRHIVNKDGEYTVAIYEFKKGILYEDVSITRIYTNETEVIVKRINELKKQLKIKEEEKLKLIKEEVKKELKQKVSRKTYGNKHKPNNIYDYNIYNFDDMETFGCEVSINDYFDYLEIEELGNILNYKKAKRFINTALQSYEELRYQLEEDEMFELWEQAKEEVEMRKRDTHYY